MAKTLIPIFENGFLYRVCKKCEKELELSQFDKCSKTKCGFRSVCKTCRRIENINNSSSLKIKRKKYYESKKEILLRNAEIYRIENKEKILLSAKKYRENNKEKVAKSKRKSTNKRYKTDGFYRTTMQLRKSIKRYFNFESKSKKTMQIIGCSKEELKLRIESLFEGWMTWDNYGYGEGKWVIDHIIPLSSAKNLEELYSLCHYTNLQPLCWYENIKKSNKIIQNG